MPRGRRGLPEVRGPQALLELLVLPAQQARLVLLVQRAVLEPQEPLEARVRPGRPVLRGLRVVKAIQEIPGLRDPLAIPARPEILVRLEQQDLRAQQARPEQPEQSGLQARLGQLAAPGRQVQPDQPEVLEILERREILA